MKNILLAFLAIMAVLTVSAQNVSSSRMPSANNRLHQAPKQVGGNGKYNQRGNTAHLDINYDDDDYTYTNNNAGSYSGYRWYMNTNYTIADTAGGNYNYINYFYVAYDTIFDAVNNIPYTASDYNSLTVDSVAFIGSWIKNDTFPDTLKISIVQVNANGYPTSVVLWDTLAIQPLAATPYDNLDSVAIIVVTPNLVISSPHYAVLVQWYSFPDDTFYFEAGFPIDPTNQCSGGVGAAQTDYLYEGKWGNSFAYWNSQSALLPTPNGGDIYYDCNSDGMFDAGDSRNFIQNINLFTAIDINLTAGIHETNPDIAKSYIAPNPVADYANLYFTMPVSSATGVVKVFDITGNLIESSDLGALSAGKHLQSISTTNFASGIYMYSIATDNGTAFGKFIKQ